MIMTAGRPIRTILSACALLSLAACGSNLDFDLRGLANTFNTADAARQATAKRPQPDARGIISYPNYQVAVARAGDTVADVAARIGIPASELAAYNGIKPDTRLRANEVIALPRRVAEPSGSGITSGPISGGVDIATLAGDAIDRAGKTSGQNATPQGKSGVEPLRHKVERGETAYSIARLYNVSVRSLAEWNGLGPDLSVREGQYLLIPVAVGPTQPAANPAASSEAPPPPSAAKPLPRQTASAAASAAPEPPSPKLETNRTAASKASRLQMPVAGKIIRPYEKGKNEGIDISAPAGTPVVAAEAGTVAAITRDTEQVPIIVLRHADNLLTVYAGVDQLTVKKGDTVKRGQVIAKVRAASPSFVHFEVREGFESVDPEPFLQ